MPEIASVQVIGAGLIGTSIALGLRDHGIAVHIDDIDPAHRRIAAERGAGEPGRAERPDVVVVAVPPAAVTSIVREALDEWPAAVVTDVTSVKSPVVAAVMGTPGAERFVSSHPMSGRERSGPIAASARLCEGNPWVLVPVDETEQGALELVESVASVLGAVPRRMDATTHDAAVALVSHAPQVISALMAARLAQAPPEHVDLAGPGVRDVTRIAASDPALWVDILANNADAVRDVLAAVHTQLGELIESLGTQPDGVAALLESGRDGTRAIPSKHGDAAAASWVTVYVVVPDQPRALGEMMADAGQSGVNIEDLRIQHEMGRMAGVVEISVLPQSASTLVDALVGRGWPAYL